MVAHVNNSASYNVTDPTEQYFAKIILIRSLFMSIAIAIIMKIYYHKNNNKSHKFEIADMELGGVIFDYIFLLA